ncbi:FecR family protein [Rufibacter immobilis]|uniref:FecR family protein n=1 Tax=Rufibacter immobilis TaxID=1348778 RepID=A0A3M9MTQ3_9BACT|nr:FecR family protein [Rufibacter immobilis]RNI28902.1 FecR family protein [Rufibacter immobilis]
MDLKQQQELLRKYQQGTATPKEKEWVENWYNAFDTLEPAPVEKTITPADGKVMHAAILKNIRKGKVLQLWQRVASVAAVLVLMLLGAYYQFKSNNTPPSYAYLTSGKGQHLKVILPDSSSLWLNENTKLKYTRNGFGKKNREIWIESGEAYFDVKRNERLPFIVHSGQLETKVLGTAFNVKRSSQYPEIQVSVIRGKVQVSSSAATLALLTKGKQVTYDTLRAKHEVSNINPDYATAWQVPAINLERASFHELAEAYYSLYNLRLSAGRNEIKNNRYTLTLDKQLSGETALEIIAAIHQLKHRKENGKIVLH